MCLTVMVINPEPTSNKGYHLILAFNRDEFYERPTKPAEFWHGNPDIISGQDMFIGKEGGTWLGISRSGRLAMLLNILQPDDGNTEAKGRGFLVSNFLSGSMDGQTYLNDIAQHGAEYNGFNLITMVFGKPEGVETFYYTNDASEATNPPVRIKPGIVAFSNHTMQTTWPKTDHVRSEMERILGQLETMTKAKLIKELVRTMSRETPLASSNTSGEDNDIVFERQHLQERVFVKSPTYGTRTITVVLLDNEGNITFTERTLKEPIDAVNPEWCSTTHVFSLVRKTVERSCIPPSL